MSEAIEVSALIERYTQSRIDSLALVRILGIKLDGTMHSFVQENIEFLPRKKKKELSYALERYEDAELDLEGIMDCACRFNSKDISEEDFCSMLEDLYRPEKRRTDHMQRIVDTLIVRNRIRFRTSGIRKTAEAFDNYKRLERGIDRIEYSLERYNRKEIKAEIFLKSILDNSMFNCRIDMTTEQVAEALIAGGKINPKKKGELLKSAKEFDDYLTAIEILDKYAPFNEIIDSVGEFKKKDVYEWCDRIYSRDILGFIEEQTGISISLSSLFRCLVADDRLPEKKDYLVRVYEKSRADYFAMVFADTASADNSEERMLEFERRIKEKWDEARLDPTLKKQYKSGVVPRKPWDRAHIRLIYDAISSCS